MVMCTGPHWSTVKFCVNQTRLSSLTSLHADLMATYNRSMSTIQATGQQAKHVI